MTTRSPRLAPQRAAVAPSRRAVLGAGVLGGVGLAAAGCGLFAGAEKPPPQPPNPATRPPEPVIDGDVVIASWAQYVAPDLLRGFEAEYRVTVVESPFDSMDGLLGRLRAGNKYDLIFATAPIIDQMRRSGRLHVIDPARLAGFATVTGAYPYFANPWYDPNATHSMPYTIYKTGIAWRSDVLGDRLGGSWADLWDERARGHSYLLADPDEVLGLGALRLGYEVNTAEPDELSAIVDLLRGLHPLLAADGFTDDGFAQLLNGAAWLQHSWSADLARVLRNAPVAATFGFEAPGEGSPIGIDVLAIPANAGHPGSGLLFMDYLMRTENARRTVGYLGYQTPVAGTEDAYTGMVPSAPACVVSPDEVARGPYFVASDAAAVRRRAEAFAQLNPQ
jgi:spermidine/putrescine transport system substrate-binding protein